MKVPFIKLASPVIVSLLLSASASAQQLNQAAEFERLAKDVLSGHTEKKNYVITSKEDWEALWDKVVSVYHPRPAAPDVDFSKQSVIAVFQGTQPSSGYSVSVTRLAKSSKKLKVFVREVLPANDCVILTVITRPFEIILTDRVKDADRVVFKMKQDITVCEHH